MYLKVYFDVDSQSNAEIISRLTTTLGKSKETLAEEAEKEAEKNNPANFGLNFGYIATHRLLLTFITPSPLPGLTDIVSAVSQVRFHVHQLFPCQGNVYFSFLPLARYFLSSCFSIWTRL